jgi:hypothetical protein
MTALVGFTSRRYKLRNLLKLQPRHAPGSRRGGDTRAQRRVVLQVFGGGHLGRAAMQSATSRFQFGLVAPGEVLLKARIVRGERDELGHDGAASLESLARFRVVLLR